MKSRHMSVNVTLEPMWLFDKSNVGPAGFRIFPEGVEGATPRYIAWDVMPPSAEVAPILFQTVQLDIDGKDYLVQIGNREVREDGSIHMGGSVYKEAYYTSEGPKNEA